LPGVTQARRNKRVVLVVQAVAFVAGTMVSFLVWSVWNERSDRFFPLWFAIVFGPLAAARGAGTLAERRMSART
jgi:hypothetical protein